MVEEVMILRSFKKLARRRLFKGVVACAVLTGALQGTAEAAESSGPLPLTFQIRSVEYGECAYPQSDAPHTIRMDPCSVTDLSEKWFFNPLTSQVTNARAATLGLCMTAEVSGLERSVTMRPCDISSPIQRWEQYTLNGATYMAVANGSGNVLTPRQEGRNWDTWQIGGPFQRLTFPLL
ncbi:hypothetical protein [Streptomyces sp. NPDC002640]